MGPSTSKQGSDTTETDALRTERRVSRINVAVSPEMLEAIDHVIEREQITLTEAVRRLVGYGDFVYRAVKDDGAAVVLRGPEAGREREVVLV